MRTYEALGNTYTRCCATCINWTRSGAWAYGNCIANKLVDPDVAMLKTLDLAICSKWQDKDVTE